MYGPTETTVWSTCWEVRDPAEGIFIGSPIGNTQVYVLDQNLEPLPPGVIGELYIGGDGVTLGYLDRPELTAERFVPDPFHGDGGRRLYRTGDLARFRRDGRLECLGRVDNQVKLRGYRIELGEIESALTEVEGVQQAAAVVSEPQPGDQRLVAYLVLDPMVAPTPAALRRHLRVSLPDYMIPSQYVELSQLPLTPNGKIDRKALPDSGGVASSVSTELEPPDTATEKLLAGIWKELLGVDTVGIHDNFFDLGGHSLLALRVAQRIKDETGRDFALRLLVFQTLGQLAAELDRSPA
jgi:acyl-coenzyme A synthetase/AMP-(fatty) acid ligase